MIAYVHIVFSYVNASQYWRVIEQASLLPDLQLLADGDLTEVLRLKFMVWVCSHIFADWRKRNQPQWGSEAEGESSLVSSSTYLETQRTNSRSILRERCTLTPMLWFSTIRSLLVCLRVYVSVISKLIDCTVDAHVGKALFSDAIIGALRDRGKTVILVTHALHFMSQCDYIYTLKVSSSTFRFRSGYILIRKRRTDPLKSKERTLSSSRTAKNSSSSCKNSAGSQRMRKRARTTSRRTRRPIPMHLVLTKQRPCRRRCNAKARVRASSKAVSLRRRLVEQVQSAGEVNGFEVSLFYMFSLQAVYGEYLKAGRGWFTLPMLLLTLTLAQTASIMNTYSLLWWEADSFHWSMGSYQALYGCLGVAQAVFTFAA